MHDDELMELMGKMYNEIISGMKSVKESLLDINTKIGKLEASHTGLENELENAKKILYDAYIQNAETLKQLDERIQELSGKVDQHAIKIQVIEGRKKAL